MAYLRIDLTRECDSSHTEGMRKHLNVLEGALGDMYKASKNLEPLQEVMVEWRKKNDLALEECVSLPDNVYVKAIDESVSSTIT